LFQSNELRTILVIDDEDIVRRSFCDSLEDLGYEVLGAENGQIGIEIAAEKRPDLILTDLRMPIKGGIDVLKYCSEHLSQIPIIVISGAGLMEDVVEALRLGAFDYLTKPIRDPDFLQAAISRALEQVSLKEQNLEYQQHLEQQVINRTAELSKTNYQLAQHKENLEQLVEERTKELECAVAELTSTQGQLVESAKMASLGRLVAGVSHELNTPLGICLTFISSLGQKFNRFEKDFYAGKLRKEDFEKFLRSSQESSDVVIHNLTQVSDLIQNFKMVSVDVSSDMKREFDLVYYIENVVKSLKCETYDTKILINSDATQNYTIRSFPGFFSQIVSNLVINSMNHGFPTGLAGTIEINISSQENNLILNYKDNGRGMSEDTLEQLYEPFFTTARGSGGSGLGMNVLYNLVVRNLLGTVNCYSKLGQGVEFIIKLPKHQF
jgi:signal transduction histidine kinase